MKANPIVVDEVDQENVPTVRKDVRKDHAVRHAREAHPKKDGIENVHVNEVDVLITKAVARIDLEVAIVMCQELVELATVEVIITAKGNYSSFHTFYELIVIIFNVLTLQ